MRNVVKLAQLALVPGFALMGTGIQSPPAAAANLEAHLRGSYAFTITRACTYSPLPFVGPVFALPSLTTPPPVPPLPPGSSIYRQSGADSGIVTFNGDGTGTSTGRSRSMNITSTTTTAPISVSEFTTTFEYTVNGDGIVDTKSLSNFKIVFGSPSVLGNEGTVSEQRGRLQISHGNSMLVTAPSGDPIVEVQNLPGAIPEDQYRICVRSGTFVKLPGG